MEDAEESQHLTKRGGRHKPIRTCNFKFMFRDILPICVAPRKELEHWISYYWHLGFPDPKIADHALDHFNRNIYGLRYCVFSFLNSKNVPYDWNCSQKSVQRVRKQLGLKGAIQEAATFETIAEIYKVLRARFPAMGARRMVTVIQHDYSICVSE